MREILKSYKKGKKKYQYMLEQIKSNTPPMSSFGKQEGIDQQLKDAFAAGTKEFRVIYMTTEQRADGTAIVCNGMKFKRIDVAG